MEIDLAERFGGVNPLDLARPGTLPASRIYAVEIQNSAQTETLLLVKEVHAMLRISEDPVLTRERVCQALGWAPKTYRNRKSGHPLPRSANNDTMKFSEWRKWLEPWPKVLGRFERAIFDELNGSN